jgi:hypothetical protein
MTDKQQSGHPRLLTGTGRPAARYSPLREIVTVYDNDFWFLPFQAAGFAAGCAMPVFTDMCYRTATVRESVTRQSLGEFRPRVSSRPGRLAEVAIDDI